MPLCTRNIVAAALAGTCTLAAAQSGITLYGVIDAVAGRFEGAATGVNAADQAIWRLDGGGLSTSHFGVRGTEDLGDGWAAQFDLSSFVRNDSGQSGRNDAVGAPANVGADPFWSRAAWVGLSHRSLGRLRVGNVTTLLFLNSITSNAFGDSTVFGPLNLVTHIGGPQAGGTGWANSVVWDSPVFGGATMALARGISEGAGGVNGAARVAWSGGPAAASLAWQKVRRNPATFADGLSANNVSTWMLGGSYDFQSIKVYAHVGRIRNQGTEAAPAEVCYRLAELSVAVPLGGGRLLAGVAERKTGDLPGPVPATAPGGNVRRKVATLGYDLDLSKRTDVYAMLMGDRTETRTLPAPPVLLKAGGSSAGVGVRHRF